MTALTAVTLPDVVALFLFQRTFSRKRVSICVCMYHGKCMLCLRLSQCRTKVGRNLCQRRFRSTNTISILIYIQTHCFYVCVRLHENEDVDVAIAHFYQCYSDNENIDKLSKRKKKFK